MVREEFKLIVIDEIYSDLFYVTVATRAATLTLLLFKKLVFTPEKVKGIFRFI